MMSQNSRPRRNAAKSGIGTEVVISVLTIVAVIVGASFGIYHHQSTEKVELQRFEGARQAALDAPDPFLELDRFRSSIGEYGEDCYFNADPCIRRANAEDELVMAGARKGSVPALVHLFDTGIKRPRITYTDLPAGEAERLGHRLIAAAEKAPVSKENAGLFVEAAELLKYGAYVELDTAKAISLYVKAWQSGDRRAASELAHLYETNLTDIPRAYFWHVRARDVPIGEKRLSNEQKLLIERKAADKTQTDI